MSSVPPGSDRAYAGLLDLFRGCVLEPGSRVDDAGLAALVGLPADVVRPATARLVQQRCLLPEADGYRVSPMTAGDAADVLDVYELVGSEIVVRAMTRVTDAEVDRYEALVADHLAADGRVARVDGLDDRLMAFSRAWNDLLLATCGSPRLRASYEQLLLDVERCLVLARRHGAVLDDFLELPGAATGWLRARAVDEVLAYRRLLAERCRAVVLPALAALDAAGPGTGPD